jgi:hypothetical protein
MIHQAKEDQLHLFEEDSDNLTRVFTAECMFVLFKDGQVTSAELMVFFKNYHSLDDNKLTAENYTITVDTQGESWNKFYFSLIPKNPKIMARSYRWAKVNGNHIRHNDGRICFVLDNFTSVIYRVNGEVVKYNANSIQFNKTFEETDKRNKKIATAAANAALTAME